MKMDGFWWPVLGFQDVFEGKVWGLNSRQDKTLKIVRTVRGAKRKAHGSFSKT